MSIPKAYEEIIEFIARGSSVRAVSDFQPSAEVKARVVDLVSREKLGELTAEERSELDHYMQIEHLMRLAKVRARQLLAAG